MFSLFNIAADALIVLFGFWLLQKARKKKREKASIEPLDPEFAVLARLSAKGRVGQGFSFSFSVARLLGSMTALAVGIALILSVFHPLSGMDIQVYSIPAGWFGGGTAIGAGLFNLFNRPALGAVIGFAIQLAIVLFFFLAYLTHPVIG